MAAVVVGLLATAASASGAALGTSSAGLQTSGAGELYRPPAGQSAAFPTAYSWDYVDSTGRTRKQVSVGFSRGHDVATLDPAQGLLSSADGGRSFPASSLRTEVSTGGNTVRLQDGSLLTLREQPIGLVKDPALTSVQQRSLVQVRALRSTDRSASWKPLASPCGSTAGWAGEGCLRLRTPLKPKGIVRFAQGITTWVQEGRVPGAPTLLLAPYYGAMEGDLPGGRRVEVAQSSDGGRTWTTRGTVARPRPYPGSTDVLSYSEATITQLRNGNLYAVLRVDRRDPEATRAQAGMEWSVSADGISWTTPRPLTASAVGSTTQTLWVGVAPRVQLMPNGVLVLAAGRRDNQLAVSDTNRSDGTPVWRSKRVVYSNYPRAGFAPRNRGSSGYMGLAPVAANRALVVVDNCAPPPWGCPADSSGWTQSGQSKLVRTYADVVTADPGKIDIAGKLRSGAMAITSNDFRWSSAAHPETRPTGAFDGSTDYWSSAMARGVTTPARMTLRLDREQTLTRAGLSLHRGYRASAELYYTVDPAKGWTRWPAGTVTRTSHAMDYVTFSPPVRARYVQVRVTPSATCAPDIGRSCASLNELELYSGTVRSFENDPLLQAPRELATSRLAHVVDVGAGDSSRLVRVKDVSTASSALVVGANRPAARRALTVRVKPVDVRGGFQVSMLGTDGLGRSTLLYRVGISSTRGLRLWQGGKLSATDVPGTTGLFTPGVWHDVRLVGTATQAAVIVNGRSRAMLARPAAGVRSFRTWSVGNTGAGAVGELLVDDVSWD